jgi:hypothetical protein
VFLTGERLDSTERFFDRHGGKVIVIARFIEGLRQANGIIGGIAGMRWLRFLAFNALGAALWVGTWVSLGYLAGKHIGTIYHYITRYSYYALIAGAVLLVAYIAWRLLRRHRATAASTGADETHDSRHASEAAGIAPGEPGTSTAGRRRAGTLRAASRQRRATPGNRSWAALSNPAPLGSAAPLHLAIISAKPEQSVVTGRVRGGVIGHGRISA